MKYVHEGVSGTFAHSVGMLQILEGFMRRHRTASVSQIVAYHVAHVPLPKGGMRTEMQYFNRAGLEVGPFQTRITHTHTQINRQLTVKFPHMCRPFCWRIRRFTMACCKCSWTPGA